MIGRGGLLTVLLLLLLAGVFLRAQHPQLEPFLQPKDAPPLPNFDPKKVPRKTDMEMLAYQVVLDRNFLSPGVIDGFFGNQTAQALRTFQNLRGLPSTGIPDPATVEALGNLNDTVTTHTVTEEELASVHPVPKLWKDKAKEPLLAHETVLEYLAERYHSSQNAIKALNPNDAWPNPPAGSVISVPNVRPGRLPKAAYVRIALKQRLVRVYDRQNRIIAQFPCSIAKREEKRPVGELKVISIAPDPNYVFNPAIMVDDAAKQGITRRLVIPPGPNNPVGKAWVGLNLTGYGIHGTPRPEDIGLTESHGCFRLANWNAVRLLHSVSIGTPVVVEFEFGTKPPTVPPPKPKNPPASSKPPVASPQPTPPPKAKPPAKPKKSKAGKEKPASA